MSVWSNEMEVERKVVSEKLKMDLNQLALGLDAEGYSHVTVIDPTTGQPTNGEMLKRPFTESDAALDQLANFR